jgi:hypothetical protein
VTAKIVFKASFPPIQSAIKIGTDGMRIQLDVPEIEMGNAVDILALRGVVLKVTIEAEAQTNDSRTINRTKAKRRVIEGGSGV